MFFKDFRPQKLYKEALQNTFFKGRGGQFSWGAIFRGAIFRGQFYWGAYFRGVIFRGALFPGAFFLAPSSIILGEDVKVNETIPHDLKMRHELYARNPKTVR